MHIKIAAKSNIFPNKKALTPKELKQPTTSKNLIPKSNSSYTTQSVKNTPLTS